MITTFNVGELDVVGPCDHVECRNDAAGNTVQVLNQSGDVIEIPLQDIDNIVLALRAAGRQL